MTSILSLRILLMNLVLSVALTLPFAAAASSTLDCEARVMANSPASPSLINRPKYELVADAFRRLKNPRLSTILKRQTDKETIWNYLEPNLNRLKRELDLSLRTSKVADHPRVVRIVNKMNFVASDLERKKIWDLDAYNRFAFLWARLLDLLQQDNLENYRFSFDQHRTPWLLKWIANGQGSGFAMGETEARPPDSKDGWVYISTTANLGFRSMLYAQSRGIMFLGQIFAPEQVDGQIMGILVFSLHDQSHARLITGRGSYAPESKLFWDGVEFKIENSIESPKIKKLLYALSFIFFHENFASMTCGMDLTSFRLEMSTQRPFNRLNDKMDLGQAFPEGISRQEFDQAVDLLMSIFVDTCSR